MSKFIEVTTGKGEKYLLNISQIESAYRISEEGAKRYAEHLKLQIIPCTILELVPRGDDATCYHIIETYEQIKAMLI